MDNYSAPDHKPKAIAKGPSTPKTPKTPQTPQTMKPARKRIASGAATGSPAPKSIKRERKPPKKDPKMVIGIDFGTTFSGVSFAWSEKVDKISVVTSWNNTNQDWEKVPTAININITADGDDNTTWGYGAVESYGVVEWFKLLLIDEDDLPDEVRNSTQVKEARRRLRGLDVTATELISDYLSRLWVHSIAKIKMEVGEETVDLSSLHIVVTLPAIWPIYASDRMRQAIHQAGIMGPRPGVDNTVLDFISEPEAAALSTLSGINGRCDINANNSLVMVDCGGGTVDIISYKVTSIKPMKVCEIVQGQGSLCGAVFVDEAFSHLLKNKFKELSEDAWGRIDPDDLREIMKKDWENGIRNEFTGEPRQWSIRLPFNLAYLKPVDDQGRCPTITITSQDMEKVFEPVVGKIRALVEGQVEAVLQKQGIPPKYIILVGGFGRCRYLYKYLKQHCSNVEILQARGSEPWTAICKGAVVHGLVSEKLAPHIAVEVRSRISRASYGIICQEDFDETKHLEEDKIWDSSQQCSKAVNQMKWLIRRGEDISTKQNSIHEKFFKILEDQPSKLSTTIWMSRANDPPTRKDDTVTKLCEVIWDTQVKIDLLPLYVNNDNKTFAQLDFVAEMKCNSSSIEFSILHNGRRQASKNVKVEFCDRADL